MQVRYRAALRPDILSVPYPPYRFKAGGFVPGGCAGVRPIAANLGQRRPGPPSADVNQVGLMDVFERGFGGFWTGNIAVPLDEG